MLPENSLFNKNIVIITVLPLSGFLLKPTLTTPNPTRVKGCRVYSPERVVESLDGARLKHSADEAALNRILWHTSEI